MTTRTPDPPPVDETFATTLREIDDSYRRVCREHPDATPLDRATAVSLATSLPMPTVQFFIALLPDVDFDDIYPHYAPPPGL